jgi:hypothetical protein
VLTLPLSTEEKDFACLKIYETRVEAEDAFLVEDRRCASWCYLMG